MLEIIKQFVRRMLMGKGKGILQIAPKKDVDKFAADLFKKFKQNGVPDEAVTNPNDVKVIWNQITNKEIKPLTDQLKKQLERLTPKKSADVLDLTGKKIDTSKPILGGKNVPETEEQILERLNRQNKESVERLKNKKLTDPEDFAHGGRTGSGLNYLLGEDDQNSRVPFKDGTKFDPKRRTVLKGIAALATLPIIGKYFKWAKPLAKSSKVLTSVPINNISGMPAWFKPLVNKVIKEGDDVTKKFADADRQIVHKTKLPDSKTDVIVTQDLNTGDVAVDIGMGKHGFKEGHLGQPVRLEYKAAEDIMSGPDMDDMHKVGVRDPLLRIKSSVHEDLVGSGLKGDPKTLNLKPGKTKEEFWVEEAEFTGGHPENIKFEESTIEKFGSHGSNFDEVEKFATGKIKKKTGKASIKAEREHMVPEGDDMPDYEDFASGGRVPLAGGKLVLEGLEALMKKFFPGTTKIGQTSKPMASKTELKRAIAGFQERQKAAKLRVWEDETKVRAAVDDIFSSGDYKMDAEMAAEALVENNPKAFGGKLYDDIDDATRLDIYGSVLRVITNDMAKLREMRNLSKPTKTLEGIKKTGTINISDDEVASEFSRFMKETDPKGFKDLEQKVDLSNFDPKGRKKNAFGGLAGLLGE